MAGALKIGCNSGGGLGVMMLEDAPVSITVNLLALVASVPSLYLGGMEALQMAPTGVLIIELDLHLGDPRHSGWAWDAGVGGPPPRLLPSFLLLTSD